MNNIYGKNIRNRRKALGLTQTELAKKAGYSDKSSIARIENGGIDLPLSKLQDIANALDCSMDSLMGWETTYDNAAIREAYLKEVYKLAGKGLPGWSQAMTALETYKNNEDMLQLLNAIMLLNEADLSTAITLIDYLRQKKALERNYNEQMETLNQQIADTYNNKISKIEEKFNGD